MRICPSVQCRNAGNRWNSMCLGGGRMIGIVLAVLVLALTFFNAASARFWESPCKVMSMESDTNRFEKYSSAQFQQCMVLNAELATQLSTHG